MRRIQFYVKQPGTKHAGQLWQLAIANAAQEAVIKYGWPSVVWPAGVKVCAHFMLHKPASKGDRDRPTVAPGLPKLALAIGGGLAMVVVQREEQILELDIQKSYDEEGRPGCLITVEA